MWVPTAHCALGQEIVGEKISLPTTPVEDEDDEITFSEEEIDRTCRAGEDGWSGSDARPIRDLDQQSATRHSPPTAI
ncbi:hypothetical protein [Streptomyces lydicus]|uniref:hypothetical protein n=1 Tax=Streptomyces lydicus TaxID=47763 RepID=UPI00378A04F5